MSDLSADEESDVLTALEHGDILPDVRPGMFVSGWDDPDNDLDIEEDEDPHASLEREILWAAGEDKTEIVKDILLKDPSLVNVKDRDGYTCLHKACYNNNYELAEILLKYKADPNQRTEFQWTPLHSACKWNNSKLAALMLQHGADINARSEGDQTPLHITTTVSAARDTLVTLLMNPKLKPDLKNNSNETAAQIAKRTGLCFPLFEMVHPALSVETGFID